MVCLSALVIAAPSFALEVKWGGLYRARVLSQADFEGSGGDYGYGYPFTGGGSLSATTAGVDLSLPQYSSAKGVPYVQHNNRFDQRLRMYIDFVSSENLKVVTKYETQAVWGKTATAQNTNGGNANTGSGNVGADSGTLNVKNVYIDFNIPQTPLNFKVGVQGVALVDSWIIDTDVSGALMSANLKPFTVVLGYVAGQNYINTHEDENIDDIAGAVIYKEGPFTAGLVGLWQDAHNTPASVFPTLAAAFDDPLQDSIPASTAIPAPYSYMMINGKLNAGLGTAIPGVFVQNNQLFDLGFQFGYKLDYLSAYLNFVKNFGSFKAGVAAPGTNMDGKNTAPMFSGNYTGWMIDAGASYFCGPWTVNLGGFYTSGPKLTFTTANGNPASANNPQVVAMGLDVDTFTYPLTTSKYFSEIMGGGILDNIAPNGGYWRGYPNPTNLWTITLGGAWQVLPQTKLALSYWYFGTSTAVPSVFNKNTGVWNTSSSLGNEINLNITQNIVDKLNLDLVGAYLFQGNGYRTKTFQDKYTHDDRTYELGARLQWSW